VEDGQPTRPPTNPPVRYGEPTYRPTNSPVRPGEPTFGPTNAPTYAPVELDQPTRPPTNPPVRPGEPTFAPSQVPTYAPVEAGEPTRPPSNPPVRVGEPTFRPTESPTFAPVAQGDPTRPPTNPPVRPGEPTFRPTKAPVRDGDPTDGPTASPTYAPVEEGDPTRPPTNPPVRPGDPTFAPSKVPTYAPVQDGEPTRPPTNPPVRPGEPTFRPTQVPTYAPVEDGQPTRPPTNPPVRYGEPTYRPTNSPVRPGEPTFGPTNAPTYAPVELDQPTRPPTNPPVRPGEPTFAPSQVPTYAPVEAGEPTRPPSNPPVRVGEPTFRPTESPTFAPVAQGDPTRPPTNPPVRPGEPTFKPSAVPTYAPVREGEPTKPPTNPPVRLGEPTFRPTAVPTYAPVQNGEPTRPPTNPPIRPGEPTFRPTSSPTLDVNLNSGDADAWKDLYDATIGDTWIACSNRENPCGDVTCVDQSSSRYIICEQESARSRALQDEKVESRITYIELPNNNLTGIIPVGLLDRFTAATYINFDGNPVLGNSPGTDCIDAQGCTSGDVKCNVPNLCGENVPVGGRDGPNTWQVPEDGETYSDLDVFPTEFVWFKYPEGQGDVYLMSSKEAYETCNFTDATLLAGPSDGIGDGFRLPITYNMTGRSLYIASSGEDDENCEAGQRVIVNVVERTDAPTPSPEPSGIDLLALIIGLLVLLCCIIPCLCFVCLMCMRKYKNESLPERLRKREVKPPEIEERAYATTRVVRDDDDVAKIDLAEDGRNRQASLHISAHPGNARSFVASREEEEELRRKELSTNPSLAAARRNVDTFEKTSRRPVTNLRELLSEANMEDRAEVLESNGLDMDAVMAACENDLREAGLTLGDAVKLKRITELLQQRDSQPISRKKSRKEKGPKAQAPKVLEPGTFVSLCRVGTTTEMLGEVVSVNKHVSGTPTFFVKTGEGTSSELFEATSDELTPVSNVEQNQRTGESPRGHDEFDEEEPNPL